MTDTFLVRRVSNGWIITEGDGFARMDTSPQQVASDLIALLDIVEALALTQARPPGVDPVVWDRAPEVQEGPAE